MLSIRWRYISSANFPAFAGRSYCAAVDGAALPLRDAARGVGTGVGAARRGVAGLAPRLVRGLGVRVGSALAAHAGLIVHDADRRDRCRGGKIDIDRRRRRRHCRGLRGGRAAARLAAARRRRTRRSAAAGARRDIHVRDIAADINLECVIARDWRRRDPDLATATVPRMHPACIVRRLASACATNPNRSGSSERRRSAIAGS